jgi:hypothetical protein
MIVYEYFVDKNNLIQGWQSWNTERIIHDKKGQIVPEENQIYQEKIESLKNNPEPLQEMNGLPQKENILYNKEKNCNYQLNNNRIIEVEYIKTDKELFEEKYPDRRKIGILTKAIIDINDNEVQEYISDCNLLDQKIKDK